MLVETHTNIEHELGTFPGQQLHCNVTLITYPNGGVLYLMTLINNIWDIVTSKDPSPPREIKVV